MPLRAFKGHRDLDSGAAGFQPASSKNVLKPLPPDPSPSKSFHQHRFRDSDPSGDWKRGGSGLKPLPADTVPLRGFRGHRDLDESTQAFKQRNAKDALQPLGADTIPLAPFSGHRDLDASGGWKRNAASDEASFIAADTVRASLMQLECRKLSLTFLCFSIVFSTFSMQGSPGLVSRAQGPGARAGIHANQCRRNVAAAGT